MKELTFKHVSVRIRRDQKEWLKKQGNASEIIRAAIDLWREKMEKQGPEQNLFWLLRKRRQVEAKLDEILADRLYKNAHANLEAKRFSKVVQVVSDGSLDFKNVNFFSVVDLDLFERRDLKEGSEELKALLERSRRVVDSFQGEIEKLKEEKRVLEEKLSHL